MSISSSFHLFTSKFPQFINPNLILSKTLISLIPPKAKVKPFSISLHSPISFQRLTTKPLKSMSSPSTPSSQFPPNLQEIIDLFQSVQEPKAKYQQLLFYAQKLPPFDKKYQTNDNKVQGCVSQVWVRATLDDDRNVWFEAESDSVLTKGLAALLVKGLSGRPANEILVVSPEFVTLLGIE